MNKYHQEVADISHSVEKFFKEKFSTIHIEGPQLDAAEIQKSPLMVVSTHRSHVDYFFVGNTLFGMGFKNLRFAAGDNLTKLPWIGPRFRAFGAFTVSRDGGFERNYVRNLCSEVMKMLENRDAVLVFPEGGRSYNGSMLDIKGGILNAAVLSQARSPQDDVFLLPVAVSYECPPDVPYFPLLLKGKKLRKKTNSFSKKLLGNFFYFGADILAFLPMLLLRRFGSRYGDIYMDYLAPISVKTLVDIEANRIDGARDEFSAHRQSLDKISEEIRLKFACLYRLLPIHVVSAALRESSGQCSEADLESSVESVRQRAARSGQNMKSLEKLSSSELVAKGLLQLRRLKAVKVKGKSVVVCKDHIVDYFTSALFFLQEKN